LDNVRHRDESRKSAWTAIVIMTNQEKALKQLSSFLTRPEISLKQRSSYKNSALFIMNCELQIKDIFRNLH